MNGVSLYNISVLLGHKDVRITGRYAHLAPSHRAKTVNVLDRVFDMSQNPPQVGRVVELRGLIFIAFTPFDISICAVIVNRFEVFRFHSKPGDVTIFL